MIGKYKERTERSKVKKKKKIQGFLEISKMSVSTKLPKIVSYNGIKFPKRMPNNHILSMILNPPPSQDFYPQEMDGLTLPPKISIKDQELLRKTCQILEIDPVEKLGMPFIPTCTPGKGLIERLVTRLPEQLARKEEK